MEPRSEKGNDEEKAAEPKSKRGDEVEEVELSTKEVELENEKFDQ